MEFISMASVKGLIIGAAGSGLWQLIAWLVPFVIKRLLPSVAQMFKRIKSGTSIRFKVLISFQVSFGELPTQTVE